MTVLVARHGLSEANNWDNIGSLAFAAKTAPLMEVGREQAIELGKHMIDVYGFDTSTTAVAVSGLARTKETAIEAGFQAHCVYPVLDEVEHGLEIADLRRNLDAGILPPAAIEKAVSILEDPPGEEVWVTHGLVIAGLCAVLGKYSEKRLIPRFCEVRELPINL